MVPLVVRPSNSLKPEVLDLKGLGDEGAMLLPMTSGQQLFQDRALFRRLLMSGKSHTRVSSLVDNYTVNVVDICSKKRKRQRPTAKDVVLVLQAAFAKFPRLGAYSARGGEREVVLNTWPKSETGQVLFHNELMQCCGLTLRELSQKRASFHEEASSAALARAAAAGAPAAGSDVGVAAAGLVSAPAVAGADAAGHDGGVGAGLPGPVGVLSPTTPPAGVQGLSQVAAAGR